MAVVCAGALALVGCGDSDNRDPPVAPTAKELGELRAAAKPPVYWLGPSYRGQKLAESRAGDEFVAFSYGEPSPASSDGWSYPIEVATVRTRRFAPDGRVCWRRLKRAWLVGCGGYEEVDVLTGDVLVSVRAVGPTPESVARSLQRFDGSARTPLEPPQPFSCKELDAFPRQIRKAIPRTLRGGCG